MASRSRVSQQSFRTLKSVTSGLLVSPKRVVKAAPMISSGMWWRQASQRICLLSSVCRITQHPLLTPVFEDIVSKPQAMIFSATPHSTSTSFIFSASTLPVDCSILAIHSSLFSVVHLSFNLTYCVLAYNQSRQ